MSFQRQASDLCDRTSIKYLTRVDAGMMQNRAEMHVELSEQALQSMICLCLCWEGLAVVWSVSGLFTQFNTNSSRITAWHRASSLQCNTRTERHNRTERQTVTMEQFRRWRLEHSHIHSLLVNPVTKNKPDMRKIGRTFSLFSCDTKIKDTAVAREHMLVFDVLYDIQLLLRYRYFVMSEMLNTYSAAM